MAALAGESTPSPPMRAYGDSYPEGCSPPPSGPGGGTAPGSDLDDLPLLLFPEDELEWLALPWPVGVAANIELMFILETAGIDSLRSSTGVCTGCGNSAGAAATGVAIGIMDTGGRAAELDSPGTVCASALA